MSPCLLVLSSLISIILCELTLVFDTHDLESLLGILIDGMCVIHTPIQWNYGHLIQIFIFPPRTPYFV